MNYLGEIAAILVTLMWSGTSFAFTALARKHGAIQLNVDRMIVASIYILATCFMWNIDLGLSQQQLILLTISGIIGLVIGDSFYFKAFSLIGPRLSVLIMASSPFFSAILSYFVLGETLPSIAILGMIVTIAGIGIVIYFRDTENAVFEFSKKGFLFAMIGSICQAVGIVITKQAFILGDLNPIIGTFYRLLTAFIILLPISIYAKKYIHPKEVYWKNKSSMVGILLGSMFGPFLGISLSFYAIQHTKIGIASTLMSTSPIIMLPISKFIYKEKINFWTVVGSILTIVGVSLLFVR